MTTTLQTQETENRLLDTHGAGIVYRLTLVCCAAFQNLYTPELNFYVAGALLLELVLQQIIVKTVTKQWLRKCHDDPGNVLQSSFTDRIYQPSKWTESQFTPCTWTPQSRWDTEIENACDASLAPFLQLGIYCGIASAGFLPFFSNCYVSAYLIANVRHTIYLARKIQKTISEDICRHRIDLYLAKRIQPIISEDSSLNQSINKTNTEDNPDHRLKTQQPLTQREALDATLASLRHWNYHEVTRLPDSVWEALTLQDTPHGSDLAEEYLKQIATVDLSQTQSKSLRACIRYVQEREHTVNIPPSLLTQML